MNIESVKKRAEKRVDRENTFNLRLGEKETVATGSAKKVFVFFPKETKNICLVNVVRTFADKRIENFIFLAWKSLRNRSRTKLVMKFAGKQRFHSISLYSESKEVLFTFINGSDRSMSFTTVPFEKLTHFSGE